MGPVILLDKSAIEALSVEESIWVQMFFFANICPSLYAETLADLTKTRKNRASSERLVSEIAYKTPTSGVGPNINYKTLIEQDLLGNHSKMDGRPIVPGGVPLRDPSGKIGMDIGEFPEIVALQRWQNEEFQSLEREFAKNWREELANTDFDNRVALVKNIIPTGKKFSTLEQVKEFVDEFVKTSGKETLYLMVQLFDMRPEIYTRLQELHKARGSLPLEEFAPYASYVLSVDLFFYLSVAYGFISAERPSNRIDISYLYYLPFCNIFVSKDKLHARTVPLFCRAEQVFLPADELKVACKEMDEYYSQYEKDIEERGLISFVGYPPYTLDNAITKMWDMFCVPSWRDAEEGVPPGTNKVIKNPDASKPMKQYSESERMNTIPKEDDVNFVYIKTQVKARRGKWRMISQEIIDAENNKKSSK